MAPHELQNFCNELLAGVAQRAQTGLPAGVAGLSLLEKLTVKEAPPLSSGVTRLVAGEATRGTVGEPILGLAVVGECPGGLVMTGEMPGLLEASPLGGSSP
jgi:hypothetical protein